MRHLTRRLALTAGTTLLLGALAACGSDSDDSSEAKATGAGEGVTQQNAWGTAEIPADPQRVAVVSAGDRAIAYSLGIEPVIEWDYPSVPPADYVVEKRKEMGFEATTYDGTDGTDFLAIAKAKPDVILGMNSYSMPDDYAKLSKIAPVITFSEPGQAEAMTWQDRLLRAAEGLGMTDDAEAAIAANEKVAADARAAHPEFEGATYTSLIVHPEQITYNSFADADPSPLDDLGLVKPAAADGFSLANNSVSLENLDVADADVVLIAYPFGDEGLLTRKELESNPLWQDIPAVRDGRWAIVDSASGLASDLAYPDVLSYPVVVEEITPVVAGALAGDGA